MLPGTEPLQSPPSDLQVAIQAVNAAVTAAERARAAPLRPRVKGVAADLVTEADGAAERAAVEILRAHRPQDGILGEEGTDRPGARRWLVDGVDGTVAFAGRLSGGWCSAVALEDEHGPLAAAVLDPATGELHTAERGAGDVTTIRASRPLEQAHVAAFFRQDRLVLPGVRELAARLLDRAGLLRHAGPGSLELAWVAAGRLDAWIQPQVDPWDWLPGALLVTEAGGAARVVDGPTRWHIAGPAPLVDELEALALRQ
jgi:myo-inositol-1(or 4)-monophosphatase